MEGLYIVGENRHLVVPPDYVSCHPNRLDSSILVELELLKEKGLSAPLHFCARRRVPESLGEFL